MSAAFTPGPWLATRDAPNGYVLTYSGPGIFAANGDYMVAEVLDGPTPPEANARLIAAAPEMFEALEAYEARINDRDMGSEYLTSLVLAALAKARGEA